MQEVITKIKGNTKLRLSNQILIECDEAPGLLSGSPRAGSRSGSASQAGPVAPAEVQQFVLALALGRANSTIKAQTFPVRHSN